jgi:hypothetical protein
MFIRISRQKRVDGSVVEHYQLVESVWNPTKGRPDTKLVHNVGRLDDPRTADQLLRLARGILKRCAPEELVAGRPGWRLVDAWPLGDLHVVEQVWQRLGLDKIITRHAQTRSFDFPLERALFAMVANRACAPASKLRCFDQWLKEDVRLAGTEDLKLHHLYRAMDFFEANKETIEREIYLKVSEQIALDVELVFYDTTSLHFEVDEEDDGVGDDDLVHGSRPAGAKKYKAPRKRGHSKNGRSDAPQIVVGLAVTRDGVPIRHWVFPGNTVDVTTVAQVKKDLREWQLTRCVFVGDAGMVSAENLHQLSLGGGRYIVCMPMRRGGEVANDVLTRAGRYRKIKENLEVKEIKIGDGERQRRYVVCFNPLEAERQRKHRERVIAELEAELASMSDCQGEAHSKRACELRASGRYGKYLRQSKGGKLAIDRGKIASEERLDGKFVVHGNDDTLTAEDLALGYKQLQRVEEAWRTLKNGLDFRPVYHWRPHRIHAHVAITVLALLVERVIERQASDTWRNIRDDLRQIKLAQLIGPEGEVWQATEPQAQATKRLQSLEIPPPTAVQRMVVPPSDKAIP